MITKAIITEILDDGFHAKVRIPTINKAAESSSATPDDELYTAFIVSQPGGNPVYKVGDVVVISYEDGMYDKPAILGLLDSKNKTYTESNYDISSLNVNINCSLPEDTQIGDTKPNDINNLSGTKGNLQRQIDLINESIVNLKEEIDELKNLLKNK